MVTHIQTIKITKDTTMRLEDLALRLQAVETKLATLTGTTVDTTTPVSIEELDARLSVVEVQVQHLVVEKTERHIDAIVAAPANDAPVKVEEVVALSASADHPEAADIVADVVTSQIEATAFEHSEIADIIATAIMAIVTADPEVVVDAEAITKVITDAIAEMPAPAPEVVEQVVAAVAEVIATATGVDAVTPEVQQQVADAVAIPSDTALDAIEKRLNDVEVQLDSLLGK